MSQMTEAQKSEEAAQAGAESPFATIEEAIEEIRRGRMVIVCDGEERENEGDLVMAAQFATPEAINFMAKEARGLICLALTPERCDEVTSHVRNKVAKHGASPAEVSAKQQAVEACAADRACVVHALDVSRVWVTVDVAQVGDRVAIALQANGTSV